MSNKDIYNILDFLDRINADSLSLGQVNDFMRWGMYIALIDYMTTDYDVELGTTQDVILDRILEFVQKAKGISSSWMSVIELIITVSGVAKDLVFLWLNPLLSTQEVEMGIINTILQAILDVEIVAFGSLLAAFVVSTGGTGAVLGPFLGVGVSYILRKLIDMLLA